MDSFQILFSHCFTSVFEFSLSFKESKPGIHRPCLLGVIYGREDREDLRHWILLKGKALAPH